MKPKTKGLTAVHKRRIRKLVDALRSGKYKQTTGALRHGDSFCCLGVACDLHSKATKIPWMENHFVGPKYLGSGGDLPTPVARYYGFDRVEHQPDDGPSNPTLMPRATKEKTSAVDINDDGASFKRIATLFERRFLKEPTCPPK